jgi:hypothetical protein
MILKQNIHFRKFKIACDVKSIPFDRIQGCLMNLRLKPEFRFKVWETVIDNFVNFEAIQYESIIDLAFKLILEPIKASQQLLSKILELQFLRNQDVTVFNDKFNHFANSYKISHSIATSINLLQKPNRFLEEVSRLKEFQKLSHIPSQIPIVNLEIFKTNSISLNSHISAMIDDCTQLYAKHLTDNHKPINNNIQQLFKDERGLQFLIPIFKLCTQDLMNHTSIP